MAEPNGETVSDTLFEGALICRQGLEGYRFSIDAVLLAHFPKVRTGESILDLGTGCGVVSMILLHRYRDQGISATGIEQQDLLFHCAEQNRVTNGFEDCFTVLHGAIERIDIFAEAESFSLVVANPPYYPAGSGRLSRNAQNRTARHQNNAGLETFVMAAARSVRNRGRVAFIYPAEQIALLLMIFSKYRLEVKRMRFVYAYPESGAHARLVLVEAVKNGRPGVAIEQPLHIYERRNGSYSEQLREMYQP